MTTFLYHICTFKNLKAKFPKTAQNIEKICYTTGLESFCMYLTSLTFPWTHHGVLEEAGLAAWVMVELTEALAAVLRIHDILGVDTDPGFHASD